MDLSVLNEEQLKPVMQTEGAVLVTAGAGSGKTRLLTYRIAHLINDENVAPYNILALTFTNKAANEMKERLEKIGCLGGVWVFTFHSLCVRILRKYAHKVGFNSNFTIYGESEKLSLVKKILKSKKLEEDGDDGMPPAYFCDCISSAKNAGYSPEEYANINKFMKDILLISTVYKEYNESLKKNNAFDYDDLLNYTHELLKNDEEAREYYQDKFKYILIDEFQDTNTVQYETAKLLAGKWGNIFVVGDEDQSIYGWRGANFQNIFDFRKEYKNVATYKLEQNYRSTKKIISLANKVIKNNSQRLDKNLWTGNEEGAPVVSYCAISDKDEANYVLNTISKLMNNEGYKKSDFAILMRINALTRSFEEKFIKFNVPHKVFGGLKFFERKEVKDVLAYLKVVDNHLDSESLLRIINFPKRGIGEASIKQLSNYADLENISLYDAIVNISVNPDLPNLLVKKFLSLQNLFKTLDNAVKDGYKPSEMAKYLYRVLDLDEAFSDESDENEARKMNIQELIHGIEEYEKDHEEALLSDYLQSVSLYSDTDEMNDDDYITLATIHSAKGLEFKVVFLVGMEEGVFPSSKSVIEDSKLEEERRLLYVAITRAMKRLYVTRANERYKFGNTERCLPSRFLKEMGFAALEPQTKINDNSTFGKTKPNEHSYGGGYGYQRTYAKTDNSHNADEVPVFSDEVMPKSKINTAIGSKYAQYKPGVRVKHSKFGIGTVKKLTESNFTSVTVDFDGFGEMTLMAEYAKLEVL